jgi:hypothetical protein
MRTNLKSRLGRASAALAIAGAALVVAGASAEARDYRGWHRHHHHWNNGWHNGWNNHWRGGWNGWRSSNGYGYTWPQRYWRPPIYSAPAYYPPRAYSYYPEPVGPSLSFTIPLR